MNDLANKKILIAGGTGQIGSFLAEKLINSGAIVYILGRNLKKDYFQETKINESNNFIKFDLINDDIESIKNKIKDVDYLVHSISDISHETTDLFYDARNSIDVNLKILSPLLCNLQSIKGICFLSSIAVYGKTPSFPIDENHSTNPISFYGCGKLGAEKFLQNHCDHMHIPLTILRISQVFGPRNLSNQVIPMFIKKFLNNESVSIVNDVSKDFIYVTDVADVIITSILKNKNGIFNIGSGEKITINKISNIISKLTKSKNETQIIKKQGEYNSFIKINKAQNELNFLPKITLEQGLKKEIEWHTKYNDYGHFGKFGE